MVNKKTAENYAEERGEQIVVVGNDSRVLLMELFKCKKLI